MCRRVLTSVEAENQHRKSFCPPVLFVPSDLPCAWRRTVWCASAVGTNALRANLTFGRCFINSWMSESSSVGQWQKVEGKSYLAKQFRQKHLHVEPISTLWLSVFVLTLFASACPYKSPLYIYFIKVASEQNSSTKLPHGQQFDSWHRSDPNGKVLFPSQQCSLILLPWRRTAEVNTLVL